MQDAMTTTAEQFSRQAEAYAESVPHAWDADLDLVSALAEPGQYSLCLDVATGPGHTAFRIAAKAAAVIAVDISDGMLATARRLAAERGVTNVVFERADAAALPFQAGTFDLVTCRIAPHHFQDIPGFLTEVRRVLKEHGRFVLEDSMAPEDPEVARWLHRLECRRDPTHVRSLRRDEWHAALRAAGLAVTREHLFLKRQEFRAWLRRASLDEAAAEAIEAEVRQAPPAIRDALFGFDGESVVALRDTKLILRAEPTAS
jgi:ubiquinone/menaquinone biosynthesis C-methylase UbiE